MRNPHLSAESALHLCGRVPERVESWNSGGLGKTNKAMALCRLIQVEAPKIDG